MKQIFILMTFIFIGLLSCKQAEIKKQVDPTKRMTDTITAQDKIDEFEKKRDTISLDTIKGKLNQ